MRTMQKIAAGILTVAVGITVYGLLQTGGVTGKRNRKAQKAPLVDDSSLRTAQQLAPLAETRREQEFAKEALRVADYEVDLAYEAVQRDMERHPPALSPEVKAIQDRKQLAQKRLDALQARLETATTEQEKAAGPRRAAVDDEVAQIEASAELAEDEVNDAKEDLERAGGDPQERIQKLREEHKQQTEEAQKSDAAPPPPAPKGLVQRYQVWSGLGGKRATLVKANQDALAGVAALTQQHDALEAKIEQEKQNAPAIGDAAAAPSGPGSAKAPAETIHEEAASLLTRTQDVVEDQKNLASLDKRIGQFKALSAAYSGWISLVDTRRAIVTHRMLLGLLLIFSILLVGLFFDSWLERLLGKLRIDRRQLQTLRAVTRVTLQVLGALLILLVVFGPPTQLATILGLAGAGLTVALKDFIIGFIGWFVLMGKNGIRLGDWVEINGVTGEVVELGMFHTVLLETGNWADSGHPTGRRVTFTNSYAIEGHYFNFSTAGQWLWDEVRVTVPAGQDPLPIIDAVQKQVVDETKETVQLAELEWKRAAGGRELAAFTAAPSVSVKPVPGGVELSVRYIARANERHQLRSKLYKTAVQLLGQKETPGSRPATGGPALEPA
jgi:small-conductance mechanosensitive channel